MNQEIREFFMKIVTDSGLVYWPNKELDKVAELLVIACADFVEQDQGSGEELATRLKQHFGIK